MARVKKTDTKKKIAVAEATKTLAAKAEKIMDTATKKVAGAKIVEKEDPSTEKASIVLQFAGKVKEVHRSLTGGKEELILSYEKNTGPFQFAGALIENRSKDERMKITSCGPHRDDLSFLINGVDIRRYGSQGQQRTAALSLKLAEIGMIREKTGDTPVLLLDDVLSELDSDRQRYLLSSIQDIQTLITCTGVEDFVENRFPIDSLFFVNDGNVLKES